jgi:hypothetical protein
MKDKKVSMKAVVSVSEMAVMVGLSRARFYQLLQAQIFPQPVFDLRTRRPFYTQDLQDKCLTIKESGVGFSGQYFLFYSPRKNNRSVPKNSVLKKGSKYQDIREALATMGMDVSDEQVSKAVTDVFPDGIESKDQGIVLRELYRYFKKGV